MSCALLFLSIILCSSCKYEDQKTSEGSVENLYTAFLNNEATAVDYETENSISVTDIFDDEEDLNEYVVFDIDGDNESELVLKSLRFFYVIKDKDNRLKVIYAGTGYDDLLNDGSILATVHQTGPDHFMYTHRVFDIHGLFSENTYEQYDDNCDGQYDGEDLYFFNRNRIEYDSYIRMLNSILDIGTDQISWSTFGGNM